jgi:hypothetical protein
MAITTDRDLVRLYIGDTDTENPLLYDDELDALIDRAVSVLAAAADACEVLAAKFAREFNISEDNQSWNLGERSAHYLALAKQFRERASGIGQVRVRTTTTPDVLPAQYPYLT